MALVQHTVQPRNGLQLLDICSQRFVAHHHDVRSTENSGADQLAVAGAAFVRDGAKHAGIDVLLDLEHPVADQDLWADDQGCARRRARVSSGSTRPCSNGRIF